ncbi:DUF4445 domain-containing protein [Candidatus Sumerlaeota bacterium]|nr:DUF4445 domain-containing protein [Candidatus Sumerlaeota bacterium]
MPKNRMVVLTVEPGSRRIEASPGTRLSEAFRAAGVEVAYPCGEAQLCGRCLVRFESGAPRPTPDEERLLSRPDLDKGVRLACCCLVTDDGAVRVENGETDRVEPILDRRVRPDIAVDPEARRFCCTLSPSTLETPLADWPRVAAGLPEDVRSSARPTLDVLRKLPSVVSSAEKSDGRATVTISGDRVIDVVCGNRTDEHLGVAVDVGTTTLVGELVDMRTGEELASASCLNPQREFGLDIISRIHAVQKDPANLERLHRLVVGAIGGLIERMCAERRVASESIVAVALAGNTLMSHLLLSIDPSGLGRVPFAGTIRSGVRIEGRDLGLPVHPNSWVCVLPSIGGFVGGDIVAGMLLTRMKSLDGVSVLVDIGTNGEVAVANQGRLHAASSAAGPAFEGGKISCGMMAAEGAIDRVTFDDGDLRFRTIGDAPPRGVCGSGLIELFARALDAGLIEMNGRIVRRTDPRAQELAPALAARLDEDENGAPRIVLVAPSDGREGVFLTQDDVREFQLAKGAVQAAIRMVLAATEVPVDRIDRFLVAGVFGNHMNMDDAVRLGIVPEMAHSKIAFIGNSSIEGARSVLLSREECRRAEEIARETEFVELAGRPEFQEQFAMSMMLGPAIEA